MGNAHSTTSATAYRHQVGAAEEFSTSHLKYRANAERFWANLPHGEYTEASQDKGRAAVSVLLTMQMPDESPPPLSFMLTRRFPGNFYSPLLRELSQFSQQSPLIILQTDYKEDLEPGKRAINKYEINAWMGNTLDPIQNIDDTFFVIGNQRCRYTKRRGGLYFSSCYMENAPLCYHLMAEFIDIFNNNRINYADSIGPNVLKTASLTPYNLPFLVEEEMEITA